MATVKTLHDLERLSIKPFGGNIILPQLGVRIVLTAIHQVNVQGGIQQSGIPRGKLLSEILFEGSRTMEFCVIHSLTSRGLNLG